MKKALLAAGIVLLIVGVVLLAFAALNLFGYRHVLDGSAELYVRLHQRAVVCFALGGALTAFGAVCIYIQTRV